MTGVSALVPMKGHSERVPRKNLRDFGGVPLLAVIIGSLERSGVVDEILVNTDDTEIAEAARRASSLVRVVERPQALCGDMVSMNRIIEHDLASCTCDTVLQTHATNPLVRPETIRLAVEKYAAEASAGRADSLFTVTRLQTRLYWQDGTPINHDPSELLRTQDLPPVFEENSCLYVFSRASFEANNSRLGARPCFFSMDPLEAVDIDEETDFAIALALHERRSG